MWYEEKLRVRRWKRKARLRERERERVRGSVVQKYAVMGWWWVLFAYEFSPSVFVWKLFLFLLWEPAWKLPSSGPNSHSTFKSVLSSLSLAFSLQYASIFLCFLLLFGPHVRLRASNGQMGWPPTHEHTLCSIPTTIISSPLCISLCVCRTRLFASAIAQAFNSDTRAVKTPIKPVSAHHSIPKTKGLLVREETEPWSKSPSAASEYGKAHYAVRLSVLLAFTGLLTVYIVRRLFTRWSLGGGSKEFVWLWEQKN